MSDFLIKLRGMMQICASENRDQTLIRGTPTHWVPSQTSQVQMENGMKKVFDGGFVRGYGALYCI
jgi:hypothetical protein